MLNTNKPVYIKQTRKGRFVDKAVLYSISTVVVVNPSYEGDARDPEFLLNLFVKSITDEKDPSRDVFSNYATIADLDLLPTARDTAIARSLTNYRDNTNLVSFDNLSVATTAATVIRDTLNNVVDIYLRVKNEFIGTDKHYFPYPEEVSSLREQFINEYKSARDAREAAEEAQDVAQYEYDLAEELRLVKEECEQKLCDIANRLTGLNTLVQLVGAKYVATLSTVIDASITKSDSLINDVNAATVLDNLKAYIKSDAVKNDLIFDSSFTSEIDTSGNGLTLLGGITQANTVAVSDCHRAGLTLQAAKDYAESKLSDLKDKQVLKEAASQAEEAALAQLTLYCPNLDPSTI
jgi:hypothetical protein